MDRAGNAAAAVELVNNSLPAVASSAPPIVLDVNGPVGNRLHEQSPALTQALPKKSARSFNDDSSLLLSPPGFVLAGHLGSASLGANMSASSTSSVSGNAVGAVSVPANVNPHLMGSTGSAAGLLGSSPNWAMSGFAAGSPGSLASGDSSNVAVHTHGVVVVDNAHDDDAGDMGGLMRVGTSSLMGNGLTSNSSNNAFMIGIHGGALTGADDSVVGLSSGFEYGNNNAGTSGELEDARRRELLVSANEGAPPYLSEFRSNGLDQASSSSSLGDSLLFDAHTVVYGFDSPLPDTAPLAGRHQPGQPSSGLSSAPSALQGSIGAGNGVSTSLGVGSGSNVQRQRLSLDALAALRLADGDYYAYFFQTLHEEPDIEAGLARIDRAIAAFRYSLGQLTGAVDFDETIADLKAASEQEYDRDTPSPSLPRRSELLNREPGQLVRTFLAQIVRLAYECPVPEYSERFRTFFEAEIRDERIFTTVPKRPSRPARFLPSSLFAAVSEVDSVLLLGSGANADRNAARPEGSLGTSYIEFEAYTNHLSTNAAAASALRGKNRSPELEEQQLVSRQVLYDIFLTVGRVSHLHRVLAIHPTYFEIHFAAFHYVVTDVSLPLPPPWRAYIMCLAAARFASQVVVDMAENQFLASGGDSRWLLVPVSDPVVPAKLRNFMEVLQILCHRPWLLRWQHIAALCALSTGPKRATEEEVSGSPRVSSFVQTRSREDVWSVSEVVHAITLVASAKALCGVAHASGAFVECDFDWERHLARRAKHKAKRSRMEESARAAETTEGDSEGPSGLHRVGGGAASGRSGGEGLTTEDDDTWRIDDDRTTVRSSESGGNLLMDTQRILELLRVTSEDDDSGTNGGSRAVSRTSTLAGETSDGVVFTNDFSSDSGKVGGSWGNSAAPSGRRRSTAVGRGLPTAAVTAGQTEGLFDNMLLSGGGVYMWDSDDDRDDSFDPKSGGHKRNPSASAQESLFANLEATQAVTSGRVIGLPTPVPASYLSEEEEDDIEEPTARRRGVGHDPLHGQGQSRVRQEDRIQAEADSGDDLTTADNRVDFDEDDDNDEDIDDDDDDDDDDPDDTETSDASMLRAAARRRLPTGSSSSRSLLGAVLKSSSVGGGSAAPAGTVAHSPLFVSGRPTSSIDRYAAAAGYRMNTEDFNFKKFKPFRVHMYNWKDDGYALLARFLPTTMAELLDDEFEHIYTLTYGQFGRSKVATKTKRFREAVWYYAQHIKGMFHDDYDYKRVNEFLTIKIKTFIKKSVCTPELLVESDLDWDIDLGMDEKLHVCLLAAQSARQSEILYGLHAVMRFVMTQQN